MQEVLDLVETLESETLPPGGPASPPNTGFQQWLDRRTP